MCVCVCVCVCVRARAREPARLREKKTTDSEPDNGFLLDEYDFERHDSQIDAKAIFETGSNDQTRKRPLVLWSETKTFTVPLDLPAKRVAGEIRTDARGSLMALWHARWRGRGVTVFSFVTRGQPS